MPPDKSTGLRKGRQDVCKCRPMTSWDGMWNMWNNLLKRSIGCQTSSICPGVKRKNPECIPSVKNELRFHSRDQKFPYEAKKRHDIGIIFVQHSLIQVYNTDFATSTTSKIGTTTTPTSGRRTFTNHLEPLQMFVRFQFWNEFHQAKASFHAKDQNQRAHQSPPFVQSFHVLVAVAFRSWHLRNIHRSPAPASVDKPRERKRPNVPRARSVRQNEPPLSCAPEVVWECLSW